MSDTQNTGQFAKVIVTNTGKEMIAKSQNGQVLRFTRVALGDGLVADGEDPVKFDAVKSERISCPIAKFTNLNNGQFQVQFRLSNQQVETGFWHREIGVMAQIDNGAEQLYAYTTAGNKASYIYDKTTPVEERVVNIDFVIGNAENIEVIINNSVIYVTLKDFEAHDADTTAHAAAITKHDNAAGAHKANLATKNEAVAGTDNTKFMTPARTKDALKDFVGSDLTGMIIAYAGKDIPDGFLLCNGATISRTTYARLFAKIGTLYGAGDGSTTFTLPNLIDRFLEGGDSSTAGSYKPAGLPNITGYTGIGGRLYGSVDIDYTNGAFIRDRDYHKINSFLDVWSSGTNFGAYAAKLDANKSNPIYGSSNTVQPSALLAKYCIKY